jgi:hypothetical protein
MRFRLVSNIISGPTTPFQCDQAVLAHRPTGVPAQGGFGKETSQQICNLNSSESWRSTKF